MMVGFSSSPDFVNHRTGAGHPECPDRIRIIYQALSESGLLAEPNPFSPLKLDLKLPVLPLDPLVSIPPSQADVQRIRAVHTQRLITQVRSICDSGGGIIDQGDTVLSPESYPLALLSAGAVLNSCDAVMSGKVQRAFAAVRPPGHHAEPDRAMGFCLFNNIAVGARYLQQNYGIQRIAIVDFDVHHGNGTQAVFEDDPNVLFISLHEHPRVCFPGSGYTWEIGLGAGRGYTLNIPFESGGDEEYLSAMDQTVIPALEKFSPQVVMISAGFDGYAGDPLADIDLSEYAYQTITRQLVAIADQCAEGRVISVLEGGYDLYGLGRCVVQHIQGLYSGGTKGY